MIPASYKRLLLIAACSTLAAHAAIFDNAQFDDRRYVQDTALQLNGVGKRVIWLFDAYHAALYLPQKNDNFVAITNLAGPRVMELRLLRDGSLSLLEKVLTDGIAQNVPKESLPVLQSRTQTLIATMRQLGSLNKGDVLELIYTGESTQVYLNKMLAGVSIPGKDFHDALLAIWLGPKPIDAKLKVRLLGKYE